MNAISTRPLRSLCTATLIVGLAAVAMPAAPAMASSQFSGQAVSTFDANGSSSIQVGGDSPFSWGKSTISLQNQNFNNVSASQPFKISRVRHTNHSMNNLFFPGNYHLPITTELSFSDPSGLGNQTLAFDMDVTLRVLSDSLELDLGSAASTTFWAGNYEYQLDLLGFSNDGENFYNSFTTKKLWTKKHDLYAQIMPTGAVVPVPAAAWGGMALFGALGAIHRIRRRRLNAA
ncbi:choice-of-anchor K domain-containing protein [Phycisphaerales bacterium AB-hyl4]|uniref:Choice-of-anchor K domain-containing protein n=1 Tax=Natronomicrosphaera hydrolytica TaxID=3242702 RepID=A0ABV4U4S8_9BACT